MAIGIEQKTTVPMESSSPAFCSIHASCRREASDPGGKGERRDR